MRNIVLGLLLLLLNHWAVAAQLESVQIREQGHSTAVLLTLSGDFSYKTFFLGNPDRAVIDLYLTHSRLKGQLQGMFNHHALILQARTGKPYSDTLRLVFDLKKPVTLRTSTWQPPNRHLKGVRFEMTPTQSTSPTRTAVQPQPKHASLPPRLMRDVVVVIDPGHGGKDPGAIGRSRNAEKDVVLAIALKLKKLIDRQPGMRAVLTRKGDYYVGLRERLMIARKSNADVFVAVHADAFINQHSNGASVFALSQRGATSEAARWLAEKENHSELGGVNLRGLDDQNGVIRTVLIDLSQTATIGASLQMGTRVLNQLDDMTRLHNAKVEQAQFVVLKSPDIPSILIETGFISNPKEERNLKSSYYQLRLAQAIFKGIKSYFWDYPPHGTRVEAMANGGLHVVRAGETLPSIAQQYHVSVASIKAANRLKSTSSALTAGQTLSIPSLWG